ncbi:MAG TPA: four helix bundle protein [Usitatibacter sp.]|nr:four helix bundle protein [Usitatibacter sp.]
MIVWQRSRDLAIDIFKATGDRPFKTEWALRDQLRRSAVSVPSNIAEGNERGSRKEMARFCQYAKGSLAELSTQVEIAAGTGLLDEEHAKQWTGQCEELARMLAALIRVQAGD